MISSSFAQSKWGYALGFDLGDDGFRYTVRDGGQRRTYSIAYEAFDLQMPAVDVVPASLPAMLIRCAWVVSIALAVGFWRTPPMAIAAIACNFALSMALMSWRATTIFAVTFNVFVDEQGGEAFRVIRDERYQEIVAAIQSLRRERLRRLHEAEINEDDFGAERARLDWLLVNDVIDAEEYASGARRLIAAARGEVLPTQLH